MVRFAYTWHASTDIIRFFKFFSLKRKKKKLYTYDATDSSNDHYPSILFQYKDSCVKIHVGSKMRNALRRLQPPSIFLLVLNFHSRLFFWKKKEEEEEKLFYELALPVSTNVGFKFVYS